MCSYNHLLATIDPDTGAMTYFLPLAGNFRTYLNGTHCCVGTGIENTPRYNEGIYFKDADTLWVNLYIPSELDWRETEMVVRQEGDLTRGEKMRFSILKAGDRSVKLNFRIPGWISGPAVLALNGVVSDLAGKPHNYVSIERKWAAGDVVDLTLSPSLRLEQAKDDSAMASVFFGPILLAGELGREDMPDDFADKDAHLNLPAAAVPEIANASRNPAEWLRSMPGATLAFTAHDAGPADGMVFRPLYEVHHQRYSVYWRFSK